MAGRVHKGANLLRLIQLDDLTDKTFVLYASAAPEPARTESSDTTATICQTLDFADIPLVTVEITWE